MFDTVLAMILAGANAATPAQAEAQATSPAETICSEICIMKAEQGELAKLLNQPRPDWAKELYDQMESYVACGVRSFNRDGITSFEDFQAIDTSFDNAMAACGYERDSVTDYAYARMMTDGVFTTAQETKAAIKRVRAMGFAFAMVNHFDSRGRGSPADKYAESRFPFLFDSVSGGGSDSTQSETPSVPPVAPPPSSEEAGK